jgi:hypothetical protein
VCCLAHSTSSTSGDRPHGFCVSDARQPTIQSSENYWQLALQVRLAPCSTSRVAVALAIRPRLSSAGRGLDTGCLELIDDPPERLLRASLLLAFYSVRSERQLMEQINYNLLFRWFFGLGIDDAV